MENHVEERVAMGGKVWVPYPKVSTLEAICKALDCQPGDILEYKED